MRYYLDTNMLIFLKMSEYDDMSPDVRAILDDFSNMLLTSSVCVHEFIQLCQIGKIGNGKKDNFSAESVLSWLRSRDITIVYTTELHLTEMAKLPIHDDHRDPFDRLIIAQAISDKIPLISSDRKFHLYRKHGLEFIYNER